MTLLNFLIINGIVCGARYTNDVTEQGWAALKILLNAIFPLLFHHGDASIAALVRSLKMPCTSHIQDFSWASFLIAISGFDVEYCLKTVWVAPRTFFFLHWCKWIVLFYLGVCRQFSSLAFMRVCKFVLLECIVAVSCLCLCLYVSVHMCDCFKPESS